MITRSIVIASKTIESDRISRLCTRWMRGTMRVPYSPIAQ